jgi:hypothetical protein
MRIKSLCTTLPICLVLVAIVSCGKEDKSTTAISSPPALTAIDQQGQSNFQIVQYGPKESGAGVAFNTQSSGQAALWVELDHPATGSRAAIWWGDHRLESAVSGNVISAVVPAERYTTVGKYPIQVRVGSGANDKRSNVVYFVVK